MYDEKDDRVRRLVETSRKLRGHDFLPSNAELATIPGAYATEEIRDTFKKIHLHYFTASADWWLAEVWQETSGSESEPPQWMGFGYTRFASIPEGAEWGYVSLNELEELRITPKPDPSDPILPVLVEAGIFTPPPIVIERDLHWEPKLAHECIPGIPAPADDHGYPWLLAFERLHDDTYKSESELEEACEQAANANAPNGAYRYHDGRWQTIDQASDRLTSMLEPYVKAVSDDA